MARQVKKVPRPKIVGKLDIDPNPAAPVKRRRIPDLNVSVKCPYTPRQLDRIVERACRFIEQAKKRHGLSLGLEVGDHLFVHVLDSDVAYMRSKDRNKTRSFGDIARHTGLKARTVWGWTRAAHARRVLASQGLGSTLTLTHLEHVARLIDDVQVAAAIVRWATEHDVSANQLQVAVRLWKSHLDGGGSLDELIEDPPLPAPHKRRKQTSRASSDELVTPRILILVGQWVSVARLSPRNRTTIRNRLVRIKTRIAGGIS